MKAPKLKSAVRMAPTLAAEIRKKDKLEKAMSKVSEDQVWRHESGTEYTIILVANKDATKPSYPVIVNYYGPDGRYWAQTLERFVEDKVFVRNYESAMTPAEQELGPWMSACVEDDSACAELKIAAQNWLNELPFPREG